MATNNRQPDFSDYFLGAFVLLAGLGALWMIIKTISVL